MNWTLLYNYLFGKLTLEFAVAFYIFSIIGMVLTMLIHLNDSKSRAKKSGKKFKFSFKFWFQDNWLRVLANLLIVFVVLTFYSSFHPGHELNMFVGFATGFSIDTVIVFIRDKTKINIFQSSKNTEG